jgi:hypothetical protein
MATVAQQQEQALYRWFCTEPRKRDRIMTGLDDLDANLRRQYEGAYGPFVSGEYAIGEQLRTRYATGTVLWSYRQPLHGLAYLIDDSSGWPLEVMAHEVQS